jgi:uncharacterized lipoprotein YbaY
MQRIALPPTAIVRVSLVDVSRADAASITRGAGTNMDLVLRPVGAGVPQ